MVAAWMRAETGVGPSMASGSHACSGNWPDLPHAPSSSSRPMRGDRAAGQGADRAEDALVGHVVPSWANIRKIARARPTSPTRFMMNAFLAAVAAAGRVYQNAISR